MCTPNIQTIDLAHIRDTSPAPTSDVKFTFVNKITGEKKELLAHKLVLAFGSEVFMAQFYGSLREESDTIPVEDSSFDAFKALLDVIYNKKVILQEISFELLAKLFYLADKYILKKVAESIIKEVSSRKIVPEKLLEAAKVAEDNVHFETFSQSLYEVCAKFVKGNLEDVMELFSIEEAGGANSIILHKLMGKAYTYRLYQADYIKLRFVSLDYPEPELHYRVKQSTRLRQLKRHYSERIGVPVTSLRFQFYGHHIDDEETPVALGMEESETIEVYLEQS